MDNAMSHVLQLRPIYMEYTVEIAYRIIASAVILRDYASFASLLFSTTKDSV